MTKHKRTLLDIAEDIVALDDLLDECDGDVTGQEAAVAAFLDENDRALEEKVDGYVALIREHNARADVLKQEEKRVQALRKTSENRARFLKDRLLFAFQELDIKRLDTARARVSVAQNGGKVPLVVDDADAAMDAGFVVVSRDVDKEAIRATLQDGGVVPGAKLGERGVSLRIK